MASKNKLVPTQGLFVKDTSSTTPGNPVGLNAAQKDGVILPSAARAAAAYTSNPYFSSDVRGIRIYIDITNANGGTVTVKLQIQDPVSGSWMDFPLAVTSALAANATSMLSVYPGQSETANTDVSDGWTGYWRVVATVAVATVTFSLGGEYLG